MVDSQVHNLSHMHTNHSPQISSRIHTHHAGWYGCVVRAAQDISYEHLITTPPQPQVHRLTEQKVKESISCTK